MLYMLENRRRRKAEERQCDFCGQSFLRRLSLSKKQKKAYCSAPCARNSSKIRVQVNCHFCGQAIERRPSQIKRSKNKLFFCDRHCKERAQSVVGGCTEIQPHHYGTGNRDYGKAFKRHRISSGKGCISCSESRKWLLVVHHKDGNRSNNNEVNLEIVCANCHVNRHLKKEKGEWVYCTTALTPRNLLSELSQNFD